MKLNKQYWTLTKFILPLALTTVAQDIGEQALNRSLTESTNAVKELASFAIAYRILGLFTGAIEDFKYISIVMMNSNKDRFKIILAATIFNMISLTLMLVVGFTKVGVYIIDEFHGVSEDVGSRARKALYIFSVYPFIDAVCWIHAGILIKYKHSFFTGLGSISDVVTQVIVVAVLLKTKLATTSVFYIPLIAAYGGVIVRCILLVTSYYFKVHKELLHGEQENTEETVQLKSIFKTWAPLMAVRLCQRISRPIINLFVARDRRDGRTQADGVKSLAVLSVVFPLCHVPYGWLNEIRALEPTFTKKNKDGVSEMKVKTVRIFAFGMFCVSATLVIILSWISGVAEGILLNVNNVTPEFAALCFLPMKIMGFLPIPVLNRASVTGWLLKVKSTSALYPSVVMRLAVIIVLVNILPMAGVHGAVMGTTSLLAGFLADSASAAIGAGVVKYKRAKTLENQLIQNSNSALYTEPECASWNADKSHVNEPLLEDESRC